MKVKATRALSKNGLLLAVFCDSLLPLLLRHIWCLFLIDFLIALLYVGIGHRSSFHGKNH